MLRLAVANGVVNVLPKIRTGQSLYSTHGHIHCTQKVRGEAQSDPFGTQSCGENLGDIDKLGRIQEKSVDSHVEPKYCNTGCITSFVISTDIVLLENHLDDEEHGNCRVSADCIHY